MRPLSTWQKIIAYASLAFVAFWTAFGIYAIWLLSTHGH